MKYYGFHMDSTIPYGMTLWNPPGTMTEIPLLLHLDSMWIPSNSTWNERIIMDSIQFHME